MLTVDNLNQYYGGSQILRGISFELKPGSVTSLLGRNGVGKSTLLKCLMGLLPVKTGSMKFADRDITRITPHERAALGIGYVPQGREIFNRLTVEENLLMGLAARRDKRRDIPPEIFELFPVLRGMLKRRGGDLSGGQQQQLAIGRALAGNPEVLILDEPTEGIQPSIIKDIGRVIRSLADRGGAGNEGAMSILLVEQYYEFARDLADQYLIMSRGEVVLRGEGKNMDADGALKFLAV
ncbi:MAG: urea ABC transporter ATP-binding subunit UrtE [Betaproteobacteria bacterium]